MVREASKMTFRTRVKLLVCVTAFWAMTDADRARAQEGFADRSVRQAEIEKIDFIQIPGPNPVLKPGPEGTWDDLVVEAADAFEDLGTYYFYYHATNRRTGAYQLGVASATSPLGPFKKYGDKPILPVGPEGSWDDKHTACAFVMKLLGEGEDPEEGKYYMWYTGCSDKWMWSIGLATASNPLGPWKKHKDNPVVKDFGYLGGVVKTDGKFRMYSAFPIMTPWAGWEEGKKRSLTYHSDYSPLAMAISDRPEGPFVPYDGNPLMKQGDPGDWDDGGISEAEVMYDNGMYHMFYGGTRRVGPRTESVGYAYSFDGLEWFKYGRNPVAVHQADPNVAAFAEIHTVIERPFIYLYHTTRPAQHEGQSHPWVEALGVQVLVTERPFRLDMPAVYLDELAGGKSTTLEDAKPIGLDKISQLSLTAECKYGDSAKQPIVVHVVGSYDGVTYDTVDLYTLEHALQPGRLARKTFELESKVRYIKVTVENPDPNASVSDVMITATLGG